MTFFLRFVWQKAAVFPPFTDDTPLQFLAPPAGAAGALHAGLSGADTRSFPCHEDACCADALLLSTLCLSLHLAARRASVSL